MLSVLCEHLADGLALCDFLSFYHLWLRQSGRGLVTVESPRSEVVRCFRGAAAEEERMGREHC